MSILLHTAVIGGHELRFFSPPGPVGVDLPWVALEDIPAVAGMPQHQHEFVADVRRDWGHFIQTGDDCDEGVQIVPTFMAHEAANAMDKVTGLSRGSEVHQQVAHALGLLLAGLSPVDRAEQLRLMMEVNNARKLRYVH